MSEPMGKMFASFFQAGFECSSHRRRDGVRLDLIRATGHDRHAISDYRQCREHGLGTIRDGLRWHRIETAPGRYDWSSWLPMLEAAEQAGVEVIWDLFHYGSPDHVDQAGPDFAKRFVDFAIAALEVRQTVTRAPPLVCPLNEISFLAWAVSEGYFTSVGPDEHGWFKRQLVSAAIEASRAIKKSYPDSVIISAEPLIHIAPHNRRRQTVRAAQDNLDGMYEAYDWIMGLAAPELGGDPSLMDVVGLNFYPHNQWFFEGPTIPMGHHEYRALADMLVDVARRYRKPLMLSETGAEGSGRASWLHYVCGEVREAMAEGARMEGICLYPITAYPGWDNSRHCQSGLLSTITADGDRHVDQRLREELEAQQAKFGVANGQLRNRRRLQSA
jgi:beta-glucosidase/6-phospho-beta-glucosidase/beta-galactosidase